MKSCCVAKREEAYHDKSTLLQSKITKKSQVLYNNRFIHLSGGEFLMGTDSEVGYPDDGEGPVRKVKVNSFFIDCYTVTNKDFQAFIDDTGYITDAEKYGWSFVFHLLISEKIEKQVIQVVQQTPWWFVVEGAYWKQPEGPDSAIENRMDHPVVHVSWNDAIAYCQWAGTRLPTEAEWEFAARGGLEQKIYPWGNELMNNGEFQCNIWQGTFPNENTAKDGYISTAPVHSFTPNHYGLFNVVGNVWEWCADWFTPSHTKAEQINPTGPAKGDAKVMKGGSFLCHDSYCNRYRVAARTANTPDSSSSNIGFRCVKDE